MAVTSEVDIWNLALEGFGHVPVAHRDEQSPEANYCRRFYPQARDELQEYFDWDFTRVIEALTPLDDSEAVDHWSFAYQHPEDCLRIRRLLNPYAPATNGGSSAGYRSTLGRHYHYEYPRVGIGDDGIVDFEVMLTNSRQSQKVLTDLEEASARYSTMVEDVTKFSPSFVMALSHRLAAAIIPVVLKDPNRMGMAKQEALVAQSIAMRNTRNEFAPRQDAAPRRVSVR